MTSSVLTITYTLELNPGEDVINLMLERTSNSMVRGRLVGNGSVRTMYMPAPNCLEPVSPFLAKEPTELAALFDPTFMLANSIDSEWLISHLLEKMEADYLGDKEALGGQIKNLAIVSNIQGLYVVGANVMNTLYGYNWVVEQSSSLVQRSKQWLGLIETIGQVQEALKDALPS